MVSKAYESFMKMICYTGVLGPRITLTASTETILSAGTIGTPQLLLLSGIGPQDELAKVGVEARIDLSGVGKWTFLHPSF